MIGAIAVSVFPFHRTVVDPADIEAAIGITRADGTCRRGIRGKEFENNQHSRHDKCFAKHGTPFFLFFVEAASRQLH